MKKILFVVLCSLLAACGFHLRGVASIPFESLYVSASAQPAFVAELKRRIEGSSETLVVDKLQDAEATLEIIRAAYTKHILSISASGRVREFQLRYQLLYRLTDAKGRELIPTSSINLSRIMPFGDAQVLAKQAEERMLVRELQSDVIQQLLQRLAKTERK